MKNLVWRLQEKPTPHDISLLVEKEIITKEEARDVFFREDEKPKKATPNELDDVKKEVELLRELVLGLAAKRDTTTIIHKYIDRWPSQQYYWTQPYYAYCTTQGGAGGTLTVSNTATLGTASTGYATFTNAANTLLK
jgi:hypothetical protein